MIDHLRNTQSVGLEDLAVLVLDEADRLLEMGFAEEVRCIWVLHFVLGIAFGCWCWMRQTGCWRWGLWRGCGMRAGVAFAIGCCILVLFGASAGWCSRGACVLAGLPLPCSHTCCCFSAQLPGLPACPPVALSPPPTPLQIREVVKMAPVRRQTMLFSATMTEEVQKLVSLSLKHPVRWVAGQTCLQCKAQLASSADASACPPPFPCLLTITPPPVCPQAGG